MAPQFMRSAISVAQSNCIVISKVMPDVDLMAGEQVHPVMRGWKQEVRNRRIVSLLDTRSIRTLLTVVL